MSEMQISAAVPTKETIQRLPSKRRRRDEELRLQQELASAFGEGQIRYLGEDMPRLDDSPLCTSEIM